MPGRERVPSFQLPSGTTTERDGSYNLNMVGNIFYNTDTSNVEIYHQDPSNDAAWRDLVVNNKEKIDISGMIVVNDVSINSNLLAVDASFNNNVFFGKTLDISLGSQQNLRADGSQEVSIKGNLVVEGMGQTNLELRHASGPSVVGLGFRYDGYDTLCAMQLLTSKKFIFRNWNSTSSTRIELDADNVSASSDDRLKHNESDVSNGLFLASQLSPESYLKGDENEPNNWRREFGFIAQDVLQTDMSFAVSEPVDEYDYYSINYANFHAVWCSAIKELHTQITHNKTAFDISLNNLQTKIQLLETENNQFKTDISNIKTHLGI